MADQNVSEQEYRQKRNAELNQCKDPMRKLQLTLLLRGSTGIKNFGRNFRIMDDDGNKKLTLDEFEKGMHDCQVKLTHDEMKGLFQKIDTDNTGSIEFEEFLRALRPPMNNTRVKLIEMAFKKMDRSGDGVITADDMKGVFNARRHPKFLSGEKTEKEIFDMYLANFEIGGHKDGKVTKEEFLNYYAGVSASIDNDCYFDLMMRNAWKL